MYQARCHEHTDKKRTTVSTTEAHNYVSSATLPTHKERTALCTTEGHGSLAQQLNLHVQPVRIWLRSRYTILLKQTKTNNIRSMPSHSMKTFHCSWRLKLHIFDTASAASFFLLPLSTIPFSSAFIRFNVWSNKHS